MELKESTIKWLLKLLKLTSIYSSEAEEASAELERAYDFEKRKFEGLPPLDFDAGEIKEWITSSLRIKTDELLVIDSGQYHNQDEISGD